MSYRPNQGQGYLIREFRLLGDVVLVETNPEWMLSVIAAELESESGDKTGMVLSVTLLAPFDAKFFKEYVIHDCVQNGPRLKNLIDFSLADLYQLRTTGWRSDRTSGVCNSLVKFNKRYLDDAGSASSLKDLQKKKKGRALRPSVFERALKELLVVDIAI
jgi:hypothetical protein